MSKTGLPIPIVVADFLRMKLKVYNASEAFLVLVVWVVQYLVEMKMQWCVGWQGKSLYLELDEENVTLIDPQDLSVLNVQPIQSIRVWGVGRNNGRYKLNLLESINPLASTVAIMGTAVKHSVPDRVKPSFVILDIRAL